MSEASISNLSASVRQRLLNLSHQRGEDFNLVLVRYGIERLLYRLVRSGYAERFVLKGALLFSLWAERLHRPTRDLDLLGYGDQSAEALSELFRKVCAAEVEPDGLTFDPGSIQVTAIREDQEYQGQRVQLIARLERARINLQIDIGFGDVVTAAPEVEYPTLLDFPAPRLRAYTKEAVIAEKLQAMVSLGLLNSRMKDFYDIWTISRTFGFDGPTLVQAIQATFERRRTDVPVGIPPALTAEFAQDPAKITQWKAFLRRNRLEVGGLSFDRIIEEIAGFLMPPLSAIANMVEFDRTWPAGGPWIQKYDADC